jgi:hypothetical protein
MWGCIHDARCGNLRFTHTHSHTQTCHLRLHEFVVCLYVF